MTKVWSISGRHVQTPRVILGDVLGQTLFIMISLCFICQHTALAAPPIVQTLGDYQRSLQAPGRLATDQNANLYITDPTAGQVVIVNLFGQVVDVRTGLASPLGIAIGQNGLIYLGEEKLGSVSVYDKHWTLLYQLGQGNGEFLLPSHIAVDQSGSNVVYVADSRANEIKVYSNGVFSLSFGIQGTNPGEFDFPTGVFVTTNQEVYVVDQNNDRIQVFTPAGVFIRQFTLDTISEKSGYSGSGGRSQGITVDIAGRVYVADTFKGFIRVFDNVGTLLTTIGAFGSGLGQFRSPAGLTIDPYNRLFVASANNSRIEIIGLDSFYHFVASQETGNVDWRSTVSYSVITGQGGPYTFQWQKDGVSLVDTNTVSGSTNATLILSRVNVQDSGNYSVVVSSPGNIITTSGINLHVAAGPPAGTLIKIY